MVGPLQAECEPLLFGEKPRTSGLKIGNHLES
jgi:hypothetical protein